MGTKDIPFEYFYRQQANEFAFFMVPQELFTNPRYKTTTCTEAKVLYGMLLDRNSLSIKNNWIDEEERVYIHYSREEAMDILGIAKPKACNIFKELSDIGLIREVRQGLNRPNIIYVARFVPAAAPKPDSSTEVRNSDFRKSEKVTSGSQKKLPQDVTKSYPSHTYSSRTYNSQTLKSVSPSMQEGKKIQTDELTLAAPRNITEDEKNELAAIYKQSQTAHSPAQDFVEFVIKQLYTNGEMPTILKMGLTHEEIQGRLRKLHHGHVERALKKSKEAKNKELYFAKALLSAIVELVFDEIPGEEPAAPRRVQRKVVHQRDNFEQREYTDEELERFYANVYDDAEGT